MIPRDDVLHELASALCALTRQAVALYAPIVEDIVRERCRDVRHIERTLDGLLNLGALCKNPQSPFLDSG